MDFVTKTFKELYKLESRTLCGRSAISIFCRIDIGLIEQDGRVYYFVNEVERTHTASLWTNPPKGVRSSQSRIGLFGSTFAETFYKWLEDVESPFIKS